jgi:hypothetical protein
LPESRAGGAVVKRIGLRTACALWYLDKGQSELALKVGGTWVFGEMGKRLGLAVTSGSTPADAAPAA